MSVIYLKHERHGTKVAIDEAEAKVDEANGWTRYTPMQSVVVVPMQPVEQSSNVSKIEPAREKRKYTRRA